MVKLARIFTSIFGVGYLPVAPGTWGSLVALPCGYLIITYISIGALFISSIAIFMIGVWSSNLVLRGTDNEDPPHIVIDEFVGQWLTLIAVPANIFWYFIAFILFRFFDIFKPWPISWFDKNIKGGFGVMLDDVIAAVFAIIALWISQLGSQYLILD